MPRCGTRSPCPGWGASSRACGVARIPQQTPRRAEHISMNIVGGDSVSKATLTPLPFPSRGDASGIVHFPCRAREALRACPGSCWSTALPGQLGQHPRSSEAAPAGGGGRADLSPGAGRQHPLAAQRSEPSQEVMLGKHIYYLFNRRPIFAFS